MTLDLMYMFFFSNKSKVKLANEYSFFFSQILEMLIFTLIIGIKIDGMFLLSAWQSKCTGFILVVWHSEP